MEGKEQCDLFCNYDCLSEVSRGTAALLFLPAEALKVEPVVVCVLSNDKSDLSYQTNTACVQPVFESVCVWIMYLSYPLCV